MHRTVAKFLHLPARFCKVSTIHRHSWRCTVYPQTQLQMCRALVCCPRQCASSRFPPHYDLFWLTLHPIAAFKALAVEQSEQQLCDFDNAGAEPCRRHRCLCDSIPHCCSMLASLMTKLTSCTVITSSDMPSADWQHDSPIPAAGHHRLSLHAQGGLWA